MLTTDSCFAKDSLWVLTMGDLDKFLELTIKFIKVNYDQSNYKWFFILFALGIPYVETLNLTHIQKTHLKKS